MIFKKHTSIFDFVAEQNRLIRTKGLPKNHPEGNLEPFDIPMSSAERDFWEKEDERYKENLNN